MENTPVTEFVKLDLSGVGTLVRWAADEGWNPGIHDAEIFYQTDPDGFYGFFAGGRMVAGGSVVSYGGLFGFMGFFIVLPPYRSLGIGRRLWHLRKEKLLSRLQPGAAIGMDGVVAMQPFYRAGGFETAFRDERYELAGMPFDRDEGISAVTESDTGSILFFDERHFGFPRPGFLLPWLNAPNANAFRYIRAGELKGFAVVRRAGRGYKTGPLFAEDPEAAEALLRACLDAAAGEPLYIDIPAVNPAAAALVQKYRGTFVFECARMYHGRAPLLPVSGIYGLTSFELG